MDDHCWFLLSLGPQKCKLNKQREKKSLDLKTHMSTQVCKEQFFGKRSFNSIQLYNKNDSKSV